MKIEVKTADEDVEFEIIIPIKEFLLAKEKMDEMRSLEHFMMMCLSYYNIEWNIIEDYSYILDLIGNKKSGNLCVQIKCDDYRRYRQQFYAELYLIADNVMKKIPL